MRIPNVCVRACIVFFPLATCGVALQTEAQSGVDASTKAAARQLGERGIEAYLAGDYSKANATSANAYSLFATPVSPSGYTRCVRKQPAFTTLEASVV